MPHTMWAIGAYTSVTQRPMNHSMALNFIRSAKAPTISAGVITAKVSWKVENTVSGIVPLSESTPIPLMNALSRPPTTPFQAPPSANARLYR